MPVDMTPSGPGSRERSAPTPPDDLRGALPIRPSTRSSTGRAPSARSRRTARPAARDGVEVRHEHADGHPVRDPNTVVEFEQDRVIAWRHLGQAPLALRDRAGRRRVVDAGDRDVRLVDVAARRSSSSWSRYPERHVPSIEKSLAAARRLRQPPRRRRVTGLDPRVSDAAVAAFDFDGTITERDTLAGFLASSAGARRWRGPSPATAWRWSRACTDDAARDAAKEAVLGSVLRGRLDRDVVDERASGTPSCCRRGSGPTIVERIAWHTDRGPRAGHRVGVARLLPAAGRRGAGLHGGHRRRDGRSTTTVGSRAPGPPERAGRAEGGPPPRVAGRDRARRPRPSAPPPARWSCGRTATRRATTTSSPSPTTPPGSASAPRTKSGLNPTLSVGFKPDLRAWSTWVEHVGHDRGTFPGIRTHTEGASRGIRRTPVRAGPPRVGASMVCSPHTSSPITSRNARSAIAARSRR